MSPAAGLGASGLGASGLGVTPFSDCALLIASAVVSPGRRSIFGLVTVGIASVVVGLAPAVVGDVGALGGALGAGVAGLFLTTAGIFTLAGMGGVAPAGVVVGGVTGGFGGVAGGFAGPFRPFIIALPALATYGAATLAAAAAAPNNGKASSTLVFEVSESTASIRRRISLILFGFLLFVCATKQCAYFGFILSWGINYTCNTACAHFCHSLFRKNWCRMTT